MRKYIRRIGPVEQLEPRFLLSTGGHSRGLNYRPLIAAGDPTGTPADSPGLRIDLNTTASPFAGVGSLLMVTKKGGGSCTATPIADRFVLTAAHCVDLNDDGRSTKKDGLLSITFNLNYGSDLSHQIPVSSVQTHPHYTGFNRPSVNDDLAILTLSSPIPAGVPIYALYTGTLDRTIVMVGYGRSGDGVVGYYIDSSDTVKRIGENYPDSLGGQDDFGRPSENEVFIYDFDGPTGNGPLGSTTLGNTREATAGPGDSGGPSFILIGSDATSASSYAIAGVNTFTIDNGPIQVPHFGTMAGGIVVKGYESWAQAVLSGKKFNQVGLSGGSGGRGGSFFGAGFYHTPGADWHSAPEQVTSLVIDLPATEVEPAQQRSNIQLAQASTPIDSELLCTGSTPDRAHSSDSYGASPRAQLHDQILSGWSVIDSLHDAGNLKLSEI